MIRRRTRKYTVMLYKQETTKSIKVMTYVGYKALSVVSDNIRIPDESSDIVAIEVALPSKIKPSMDAFETACQSPYIGTLLNDGYRIVGWSEMA